jgi:hypothetical protein
VASVRRRQLQRAAAWLGRPPGRRRHSPPAAVLTKDLCEILHPSLPTRRHSTETNRQAREVVAADLHWTCELSADLRAAAQGCWLPSPSPQPCFAVPG